MNDRVCGFLEYVELKRSNSKTRKELEEELSMFMCPFEAKRVSYGESFLYFINSNNELCKNDIKSCKCNKTQHVLRKKFSKVCNIADCADYIKSLTVFYNISEDELNDAYNIKILDRYVMDMLFIAKKKILLT